MNVRKYLNKALYLLLIGFLISVFITLVTEPSDDVKVIYAKENMKYFVQKQFPNYKNLGDVICQGRSARLDTYSFDCRLYAQNATGNYDELSAKCGDGHLGVLLNNNCKLLKNGGWNILSWFFICYKEGNVKLIIAIFKPFKLDDVRDALIEIGVTGMTYVEVKGFGRQKGHTELYHGKEYAVDFLPKTRLEIAVPDELLEAAMNAITQAAVTNKIGDGKIFVTELVDVMRIRTGERGEEAL